MKPCAVHLIVDKVPCTYRGAYHDLTRKKTENGVAFCCRRGEEFYDCQVVRGGTERHTPGVVSFRPEKKVKNRIGLTSYFFRLLCNGRKIYCSRKDWEYTKRKQPIVLDLQLTPKHFMLCIVSCVRCFVSQTSNNLPLSGRGLAEQHTCSVLKVRTMVRRV